jgi:hypothetical protein
MYRHVGTGCIGGHQDQQRRQETDGRNMIFHTIGGNLRSTSGNRIPRHFISLVGFGVSPGITRGPASRQDFD